MKENKVKNYSVRSARRRKAKNKRNSVKRSRLIRKACAIKPTDTMIANRRMDFISYNANLSIAQAFSALAVNKIALVELNAIATKQLKALWVEEVCSAWDKIATKQRNSWAERSALAMATK